MIETDNLSIVHTPIAQNIPIHVSKRSSANSPSEFSDDSHLFPQVLHSGDPDVPDVTLPDWSSMSLFDIYDALNPCKTKKKTKQPWINKTKLPSWQKPEQIYI